MAATGAVSPDRVVPFISVEWGPAEVAEQDLAALSDLTGLSSDDCLARLADYRPEELAEEWRRRNPATPEEIRAFYRETECYLWELLAWNGSALYRRYLGCVEHLARVWPPSSWPRALDYGCGVGTAAIQLAERGYSVTIADVPGRTLELARRRLRARGIAFDEILVDDDLPQLPRERWDVLVCFDVVEHLVDPAAAARRLVDAVRPEGGLAIAASFNVAGAGHPQHLATGVERFGGIRWDAYLGGLGLQSLGNGVYRNGSGLGKLARRLNYELARRLGFRIQRVA
jgi:SAM-dependent methyltransferase